MGNGKIRVEGGSRVEEGSEGETAKGNLRGSM